MDRERYIRLIKEEEGYRNRVYLDSLGIPTCGWGHALHVGSTVPHAACEAFFAYDLDRVDKDYAFMRLRLDPVREAVVKCMLFQLGLGGVQKFKRFLSAIDRQDWPGAAMEMLNSKWAEQTPNRVRRLADMILTGKMQ